MGATRRISTGVFLGFFVCDNVVRRSGFTAAADGYAYS
jgi:hypothetical protein